MLTNSIFLTGASGFVGKNLIKNFSSNFSINIADRNSPIIINDSIVIHLAGKAHDLKNTSIPEDYYIVNTDLTKKIYDSFLASKAIVFIILSTVKAVADKVEGELSEDYIPDPITHYGKSKLLAEEYILSKLIPQGKRIYILRPCMIHGPGNKGNLNLLYKIVNKGFPWPLGAFDNKRSFCSIDNLCHIINELIVNDKIPSGIYNIADDEPLSTNDIIKLISESQEKNTIILKIPQILIIIFSKLGDILGLPLNKDSLNKLTENYVVSNQKIKQAINKKLPLTTKEGLIKTFNSFKDL